MIETPRQQIVRQLRMIWLRSRERAEALKQAHYTCQRCGVKKSEAKGKEQKITVHHKEGVGNWDKVIDLIREELLCFPDQLEVLCPDCHDKAEKER